MPLWRSRQDCLADAVIVPSAAEGHSIVFSHLGLTIPFENPISFFLFKKKKCTHSFDIISKVLGVL
jgi:hypothetical protein